MLCTSLPTFLPGFLTLRDGTFDDYRALAPFHYLAPKPATIADIVAIDWKPYSRNGHSEDHSSRPIAVAVLSWPVPSCTGREIALHRSQFSRRENLVFANGNVRTISRVIVHPQFRAIGLSSVLIRRLCERCNTRYIEAFAMMSRAVPLFTRAGMTEIDIPVPQRRANAPAYFFLDRDNGWSRRHEADEGTRSQF